MTPRLRPTPARLADDLEAALEAYGDDMTASEAAAFGRTIGFLRRLITPPSPYAAIPPGMPSGDCMIGQHSECRRASCGCICHAPQEAPHAV